MKKKRGRPAGQIRELRQFNLVSHGIVLYQIYAGAYKRAWLALRPKMKVSAGMTFDQFCALAEIGGHAFKKEIALYEEGVTESDAVRIALQTETHTAP